MRIVFAAIAVVSMPTLRFDIPICFGGFTRAQAELGGRLAQARALAHRLRGIELPSGARERRRGTSFGSCA